MTSPLVQLKKVPDLNLRNDLPFAELMDVLANNDEVLTEQKTLIDQHSTDPAQDKYPIIVRRGEDGLFKVMDGNRRTLRALIYGNKDIEAWAGELDGAVPINFWVPVNDMLQLVKLYKEAVDSEDSELQKATALVLKAHFRNNLVAVKVYETRIANQTDIARCLFNLTQQMS